MKKFTLTALAALTMSAAAMAQGTVTTTYVKASDKTAINNAINEAIGAGNTHIVCLVKSLNETSDGEGEVADASTTVNLGTTPKIPACGTLVIRSNQTDINNLPLLQLEFGANAIDGSVGYPSLVLENIALDQRTPLSGAGYIVSNKNKDNYYGMDSVIIKNCDIKSGRAIFREENQKGSTLETAVDGCTPHHIKKFVFEGNKCHQCCILSGNAWRPFYFVSIPDEMYLDNNIFYDMPYASQLINFHKTAVSDGTATTWNIYNNTFLMSSCKWNDGTNDHAVNLVMINAAAYVDANTTFNVYNNLFLGEEKGLYAKPTDYTDTYQLVEADGTNGVKLLNCVDADSKPAGTLTTSHNYFSKYYNAPGINRTDAALDLYEDLSSEEYAWSFDDCYDPDNSDYRVLTSNAFYTAGASAVNDFEGTPVFAIPTTVGAPIMYLDKFPVKAEVKVAIEGSKSVTYTVAPEKTTYFAGDEVTITLNDHNSYYRQFNTFKGWSDGSMETTRTMTVPDEGINLTASFEELPIVAAFDFSGITKSTSIHEYVADLGDQAGTAKIFCMAADTTGLAGTIPAEAVPYVEGNFQTRTAKFGEDAAELQMPIISRRTAKNVRDYNRDYAVLQFSTEGLSDATVDYFVGTDNNASKVQKAYYSLDNVTYTDLNVDSTLVNGKWCNVKFNIPAEAIGKEVVYIKLQGQVNNGDTPENVTYTDVADAFDSTNLNGYDVFEYLGNILITGTAGEATGISTINNATLVNAPMYNIAGQKVSVNYKGIVVKGGKKIIVK